MKFRIHKALAVVAASALIAPIAGAFAAPVELPNPEIPALPPEVPITILQGARCGFPSNGTDKSPGKCTLSDLMPPAVLPDPDVVLAMLEGQIELIAAALGEQPDELLNKVLGTEIPTGASAVFTVNDLLNRIAGTKVFDATSNGILGTTEISVGNASHSFSLSNVAKPAVDVVCLDTQTDAQCRAAANNPRALEMPKYNVHQSDWSPTVPTLIPALIPGLTPENAILGTSISLPLISALGAIGLAAVPGVPTPGPAAAHRPVNHQQCWRDAPVWRSDSGMHHHAFAGHLSRCHQPDQGQPGGSYPR